MGTENNPLPSSIRFFTGNRLKYYKLETPMDWNEHWAEAITPALYPSRSVGLATYSFIAEALPKEGKILEAGCGMGQFVHELRLQGFDCEGVDTAERTIEKVKEIVPELPISVGDVLNLPVPDAYYSGYISLGVVEHREEGPEPFLREGLRVLKKGGVAIFTVPYCNPIRYVKGKTGWFSRPPGREYVFYQQAFTRKEFAQLLELEGFTVIRHTFYDPWKGLKDELKPFAYLNRKPGFSMRCRAWADRRKWLYPLAAHMLAVICTK